MVALLLTVPYRVYPAITTPTMTALKVTCFERPSSSLPRTPSSLSTDTNQSTHMNTHTHTRTQAQLRAASALRGLSVDEDLRTQIVARGGLVPLLRLSSSDDVEIQMEV